MMDMQIPKEIVLGSNDQTITGKRKRSRRPRSSSSSLSSSGARELYSDSPVSSPPASSSGIYTSTDHEDEDMAYCLILLARGDRKILDAEGEQIVSLENKSGGRKFAEVATVTSGGAKIGIYVYECKTCSRTFSSFQALGGHRASHKKPKPAEIDSGRKYSPPEGNLGGEAKSTPSNACVHPPVSTQFVNKVLNVENKMKMHECSICGSEFGSGQALGGHMRKHRATRHNSHTSKIANDSESSLDEIGGKGGNVGVDFDLNLPAPPEEEEEERDRRGSEFDGRFASGQRSGLVFSAAALVGCHY